MMFRYLPGEWHDVPVRACGTGLLTNTTHRERQRMQDECWICGLPGHTKHYCPTVTGMPPPDVSFTNTTPEWRAQCLRERKCFHCESTEHIAKRCPTLMEERRQRFGRA